MKLLKGKKGRENLKRFIMGFLALVLVFCLVFSMVMPFLHAEEVSPLEVTTNVGFDGIYKIGVFTPVLVTIKNNGDDFEGKVQVKVETDQSSNKSSYIVYEKTVSLPANTTKAYEFNVKMLTVKNTNQVVVVDNKNKKVYGSVLKGKPKRTEETLVALMTDNKDSLAYFKDTMLTIEAQTGNPTFLNNNAVSLDASNFPTSADGLRVFSLAVIDNFDISQLNQEQSEALKSWVMLGGVLFLGTGENYSKLTKGNINEILPKKVEEPKKITSNELKIFNETFFTENIESENIMLAHINDSSFKKEISTDLYDKLQVNTSPYYSKGFGEGKVVIFTTNITFDYFKYTTNKSKLIKNIASGYNLTNVAYNLVPESNIQSNYSWNLNSIYNSGNVNTIYLIFGVVLFFAIFIGVILYLILKKVDKRENSIIFVAISSFVTSLIIISLSLNSFYNKPIIKSVSTINISSDGKIGVIERGINFLTGDKGKVDIKLNKKSNLIIGDNYGYNNYSSGRYFSPISTQYSSAVYSSFPYSSKYPPQQTTGDKLLKNAKDIVKISSDDNSEITILGSSKWQDNIFYTNEVVNNTGKVDADLTFDKSGMHGNVTNNTNFDLKYIILSYGNQFRWLEKLEVGESKSITDFEKLTSLDEINLKIGGEEKRYDPKTSYYSNMIFYATGYYGSGKTNGVFTSVSDGTEVNSGKSDITIYAITEDEVLKDDTTINGKIPNKEETTILTQEVNLNFPDGEVYIPWGLIKISKILHKENYSAQINYGSTYKNNVSLYQTGLTGESDYTIVYNVPLKLENYKGTIGGDFSEVFANVKELSIFNNQTGEFEKIEGPLTFTKENSYISDDNKILVNVEPLNITQYGTSVIPQIYINITGVKNSDRN